ncbi:helix-turn-helix transcriptional regulator [Serratia quinivorans]|uniref:helix-turn-helix transcriptional regulator n=1 Tax=Serratia quinivorans TaxID=137545 RepID=UPI0036F3174F
MAGNFLTCADVCEVIGRTKPTLWAWVKAGDFPPASRTKSGKFLGWPPSVVRQWVAEHNKG